MGVVNPFSVIPSVVTVVLDFEHILVFSSSNSFYQICMVTPPTVAIVKVFPTL